MFKNKQDKKAYDKKYYLEHKDACIARACFYRKKHSVRLKAAAKKNYHKNRAKKIMCSKLWYITHKEYVRQYWQRRRNTKEYKLYHRKYATKWAQKQRVKNPGFVIMGRLRCRINSAIRSQGTRKSKTTEQLIGCSIKTLLDYLASKFLPGMTWENRRMWHIDHIKPVCKFDLTKVSQQHECFNFKNLQPLWIHDNLLKGRNG